MSTSTADSGGATVADVRVSSDTLSVELSDGRTIAVPLGWYPRLAHATAKERANWRPTGSGLGIHWPALDEDVSVEGLLAGRSSTENQKSLARWLAARPRGKSIKNATRS